MKKIFEIILENASFYDAPMNEIKLKLFAKELEDLSLSDVDRAFAHFRREPGRRVLPMPADIRGFIKPGSPDGRPGVEEAWAMCPISESQTVVWTQEVKDAFFSAALPLIERDEIAARMAFKEAYLKKLAEARAENRQVKWEVSLGQDKVAQERVIVQAVSKNLLTAQEAKALLPDISFSESRKLPQLSGPEIGTLKKLQYIEEG
jgi:hypothetical protein